MMPLGNIGAQAEKGGCMTEDREAPEAIRRQLYQYCRAVDRLDASLGYLVWHNDGTADYGPLFQGTGRGFIDWVIEQHRGLEAHSHQITNILIELEGHEATSEAYVTAALWLQRDGRLLQADVRGRYLDKWSRRHGRWAIFHRRYVHDFDYVREVTASLNTGWGRRDRQDPSYLLQGFGH
jgi:hypothetical protein